MSTFYSVAAKEQLAQYAIVTTYSTCVLVRYESLIQIVVSLSQAQVTGYTGASTCVDCNNTSAPVHVHV